MNRTSTLALAAALSLAALAGPASAQMNGPGSMPIVTTPAEEHRSGTPDMADPTAAEPTMSRHERKMMKRERMMDMHKHHMMMKHKHHMMMHKSAMKPMPMAAGEMPAPTADTMPASGNMAPGSMAKHSGMMPMHGTKPMAMPMTPKH